MTQIIKHQEEPAAPPPATFDILGLDAEQLALITALVGHALTKTHEVKTFPLYRNLKDAVVADDVAAKAWERIVQTVELSPKRDRGRW